VRAEVKVVAIIPTRMASTRFPGKPLAKILGLPMIEHVYRRVQSAELVDEIYVATCDKEIADEVKRFSGMVIMTSSEHTRGSERVAEAAQSIETDIVINVQGDEPMVDPLELDKAIRVMKEREDIRCLNLVTPIEDWEFFTNKNVVKVALAKGGEILYFSRAAIPEQSEHEFRGGIKQIGIYLIHKDLLLQYSRWKESTLEKIEKVDMLRFLENNSPVHAYISTDMIGVDTKKDLAIVERLLPDDYLYNRLFKLQS